MRKENKEGLHSESCGDFFYTLERSEYRCHGNRRHRADIPVAKCFVTKPTATNIGARLIESTTGTNAPLKVTSDMEENGDALGCATLRNTPCVKNAC